MYRIVRKEALRPTVTLYEIEAPLVALIVRGCAVPVKEALPQLIEERPGILLVLKAV